MNSQPASRAACVTRGYAAGTAPLIVIDGEMPCASKAAFSRQNPTRIPYSCHAQFGRSGSTEAPCGGVNTCRGIGRALSQVSTFTTMKTATRLPSGNARRGRSMLAR